MIGLQFRDQLPPEVVQELDQLVVGIRSYLFGEHNEDGSHASVTALDLDVAGDAIIGGDVSIDGNLVADDDAYETEIGNLIDDTGFDGGGLRLKYDDTNEWAWQANTGLFSSDDALLLIDTPNQGAASAMLGVVRRSAIGALPASYSLLPPSSSVSLALGENSSGRRWASVVADLLRSFTGVYERARTYAIHERQAYGTNPAFDATHFTADTGSWTVASGDVSGTAKGISWSKSGLRMSLDLMIATTTTAGGPGYLKFTLPDSSTIAGDVVTPCLVFHGGTWQTGYLQAVSGETFVRIYSTAAAAAWPNETDAIWIRGQISFYVTT